MLRAGLPANISPYTKLLRSMAPSGISDWAFTVFHERASTGLFAGDRLSASVCGSLLANGGAAMLHCNMPDNLISSISLR